MDPSTSPPNVPFARHMSPTRLGEALNMSIHQPCPECQRNEISLQRSYPFPQIFSSLKEDTTSCQFDDLIAHGCHTARRRKAAVHGIVTAIASLTPGALHATDVRARKSAEVDGAADPTASA